jgi:hypothetical protein
MLKMLHKTTQKQKHPHHIPKWTYVATPVALITTILTPWKSLIAAYPDAVPLMLVSIACGIAAVAISISHWVIAARGVK